MGCRRVLLSFDSDCLIRESSYFSCKYSTFSLIMQIFRRFLLKRRFFCCFFRNYAADQASPSCRRPAMADDCEGRAGQNKHRWNPEAENTVCKDSRRERTFSDVIICVVKLSNFETCHRGNATEASAWVYYIQVFPLL